ncbi:cell surface superoxide dismutase [Cu-Zn] 4 [[Candida] anglica]|uniref:Cell surface superoxide dismutase [Cu-Zn] 4 n=1 Tax=[Candida] anglica TaxID=148631 RepID=A0ABP0EHB8_9ASCO
MVSFKFLSIIAAVSALVSADAAPTTSNSPQGVKYSALFEKSIKGSVNFTTTSNGTVQVEVDLSNFPSSGGPFTYHIHEAPVPSDGNCTGTKLHLNPYHGLANATTPSMLEVGDLSGRHGKISGTSYNATYLDPYVSLNPSDKAFPGGLSITIHFASNNSRIACSNITKVENVTPKPNSGSSFAAPRVLAGVAIMGALIM